MAPSLMSIGTFCRRRKSWSGTSTLAFPANLTLRLGGVPLEAYYPRQTIDKELIYQTLDGGTFT